MVPALRIREASPADAGEVLTLQRAAFVREAQRYGDPFLPPLVEDLAQVAAAVADEAVLVLVAVDGTRLVGSVRLRVAGTTGHVGRLAVAPDRQREGLGSALLQAVQDAAPPQVRAFALFTGAESAGTVARYERAGYVRSGESVDERGVRLVHLLRARP